jgi:hypothetical protein
MVKIGGMEDIESLGNQEESLAKALRCKENNE